jgi:hypothetical protein
MVSLAQPSFIFTKCKFLLICLTVSSRKDLSIAPCFIGGFYFICREISADDYVYPLNVVNHS